MYWTMDQAVGPLPDSNLAIPLDVINCPLVSGILGNARQFNAGGGLTNCQLDWDNSITPEPQLSPYNGGGVTHAFWIKLESGSGGFPVAIVATYLDGVDGHQYIFDFRVGLSGVINNPTFNIVQDPGILGPTMVTVTVPITWVLGQWYFLGLVYDQSSGQLKVYINGVLSATSGGSFSLPNGTWSAILLAGVLLYPTIDLDEYMIHTGSALSANQLLTLYNCGNAVTWPQAGTIANTPAPTPPVCCLVCDGAFLAAVQAAFPGDDWNGQLLSSNNYQVTSNLGNTFVIFSTGTVWRFEVQTPGTVYQADGPAITSPRIATYTAGVNTIGAPGTVTFSAC